MKALAALALVLAVACADSVTIPYTQSVGLVGTFDLATVNGKPVPSKDTGVYFDGLYVLDSGRVTLGESEFEDRLYFTFVRHDSAWALGDTTVGRYYVNGNNVHFYATSGVVYSAAYIDGALVQVWSDAHTLVYIKRS